MTETDQRPPRRPHLDTVAIRSGRTHSGDALAAPIQPSTTWHSPSTDEASKRVRRPRVADFYSRFGSPTADDFARAVADLEGAEAGVAFASGMGAVSSTILALCSQGSHIVAQRQLFAATHQLFVGACARFGIEVDLVDGGDADAIEAAIRPGTQLIFVETPANPMMTVVDLERIGAIVGPIKVVDSTFATPVVQRPLEIPGIDIVVHSATKGLAGHNDATLGVAVGPSDLINWIWGYSTIHGATPSAFDAWNGLRGLRTLPIRVRRQCETAQAVAEFLLGDERVSTVLYPGLPGHPQSEVVKRQMTAGGTSLSVELVGGIEAGKTFVESLDLACLAPSLGGPETLVNHPASMTHASMSPDDRAAAGLSDGLVRVSMGLEHVDDVIADFRHGLDAVSAG